MKSLPLVCLLAAVQVFLTQNAPAQSARQLTRRIVPPANNPPPAGGTPASRPAPTPPRPAPTPAATGTTTTTNAVPAPPPPADPEKAKAETLQKTIQFERKNAEKGSAWAQYALGVRYLKGEGVEKDETAGVKWLEAAAKQDNTLAKKKLEELKEQKKALRRRVD